MKNGFLCNSVNGHWEDKDTLVSMAVEKGKIVLTLRESLNLNDEVELGPSPFI